MKNISSHIGKLEIIKRLPNSYHGNPRYLCHVAGFTCRTKPNSSIAYMLPNINGEEVFATLGTHYGKCTINTIRVNKEPIINND